MNQLSSNEKSLPNAGFRFTKKLLIINLVFLPLMAFMDYHNGYFVSAYVKVGLIFACASAYTFCKGEENHQLVRILFASTLLAMASVSIFYKVDSFSGLIWVPVLPLLFSFLLGARKGAMFSLAYFSVFTLSYFFFESIHGTLPVSINDWTTTAVAYAFVLTVTIMFQIEAKNDEDELRKIAKYDFLTQVYNRLGFVPRVEDEVARLVRYGGELSLIMLDIDDFKRVNDRHGHAAGDAVLVEFARLLEQHTRSNDIVARWGGEEFVILTPNTGLQACTDLAEKLRQGIESQSFTAVGQLTASFGVTQYQPTEVWRDFLNRGDGLLLQAKREGKNRVSIKKETLCGEPSVAIA